MAEFKKPKKFKEDGNELIALFFKFCETIPERKYDIIPSQSNFCKWLEENYSKTDRKTIYNTLNKYFPLLKKEYEQIQSDIIAQGAMVGAYQNSMSIFVLKNWCKWSDKAELTIDDSDRQKEAQDNLVNAIKESMNCK